jgi:hypothetical protein
MGAVFLTVAIAAGEAHAVSVTSPFGDGVPVNALVFTRSIIYGGGSWVQWQDLDTGGCSYSYLGPGGLNNSYTIWAPNNALRGNTIQIVTSAFNAPCGMRVGPLNYAGYYLDLVGGNSHDVLISPGTGDTFEYGQDGNDQLWDNRAGATLVGGNGDDRLEPHNNNAVAWYEMDDGDDCIDSAGTGYPSPSRNDCGPGFDAISLNMGPNGNSCEAFLNPNTCGGWAGN